MNCSNGGFVWIGAIGFKILIKESHTINGTIELFSVTISQSAYQIKLGKSYCIKNIMYTLQLNIL